MPVFIVEYQSTGGGLRSKGEEYKRAQQARKAYRAGLKDQIVLAGPKFATDADSESISSLMILEAHDLETARAIAARDPYLLVGEFSGFTVNEVAITAFRADFGS